MIHFVNYIWFWVHSRSGLGLAAQLPGGSEMRGVNGWDLQQYYWLIFTLMPHRAFFLGLSCMQSTIHSTDSTAVQHIYTTDCTSFYRTHNPPSPMLHTSHNYHGHGSPLLSFTVPVARGWEAAGWLGGQGALVQNCNPAEDVSTEGSVWRGVNTAGGCWSCWTPTAQHTGPLSMLLLTWMNVIIITEARVVKLRWLS